MTMTRTQAVALPFSLGAHGAGLAGVLALAIGGPTDLPSPRLASPAPPPALTLGPLRVGREREPRPARKRGRDAREITIPPVATPPMDTTAPPATAEPPLLEDVLAVDPGGDSGVPCVGCEVGDPSTTGTGPAGDGSFASGDASMTPLPIGGRIR
jgi:hypothetical protein